MERLTDNIATQGRPDAVRRYRPKVGGLYFAIFVPTLAVLVAVAVLAAIYDAFALVVVILVFLTILYFAISPLFGYAELGEESLYIRYGFIMKTEIPYAGIRSVKRARRAISYSTVSLKCDMEHIEIGYGRFDETTISLVDADEFVAELCLRSGVKEG